MSCFYPLDAFGRQKEGKKLQVIFPKNYQHEEGDYELKLPCGRCIGCRLDRSRDWALRCVHEGQLHEEKCFITLTYSEKNLPEMGMLKKKDFQRFMNSFRKKIEPKRIRYYHAGEYGEQLGRPHYHAIIFGYDFSDRIPFKETNGVKLDVSEELESIWKKGHCSVGDVTFESAAYVARYIMKKINGDQEDSHYNRIDYMTGENVKLPAEYTTMSRRPGIGKDWYDKFKADAYPSDFVTHKGKKYRLPRFYDNLYELEEPGMFKEMKEKRIQNIHHEDQTRKRLRAREEVKLAQLNQLKRSL